MLSKKRIAGLLRPNNKTAFILSQKNGAKIFDIGCGNSSAEQIKSINPTIYYCGIDVGDYNQSENSFASMDRYICVTSDEFANSILNVGEKFDAVISSHNIEHCDDPNSVIDAMCAVLNPKGLLYFSFPSEATINFPSRRGTLNFRDDPTHQDIPKFDHIIQRLQQNGMVLEVVNKRNRPLPYVLAGLLLEPWSALTKQVDRAGAIWALWGFETVIWARKPA